MATVNSAREKRHSRYDRWPGSVGCALLGSAGILWSLVGIGLFVATLGLVWYESLPNVASLPSRVRVIDVQHHAPYASLDQIPPSLPEALIATEDERFYQNHGIDLIGLGRAVLDDVRSGRPTQGGSTITEQLAKLVYVGRDNTPGRKLESMGLALKIADHYPKAEVLTLYLNRVYLGHGAYGVAAASEIYFHKPVSQLDLAECALLAGLPQAPSADDPLVHPEAAKQRQAVVLQRMVARGMISPAQARDAERSLAQSLDQADR